MFGLELVAYIIKKQDTHGIFSDSRNNASFLQNERVKSIVMPGSQIFPLIRRRFRH
jgi:hypothetical protein